MDLSQIVKENRIAVDMQAGSKQEVIEELVKIAMASGIDMNEEEIIKSFMDREALGSTGIGLGVAVPHIRIDSIEHCLVVFGKSSAGVDYAAIDNKPVHLFFMIFGPLHEERQENYLKLMAAISKMVRKPEVREELIALQSPAGVVEFLAAQE